MLLEELKLAKEVKVLSSMRDYLESLEENDDISYGQKDVDKCGSLLDKYIDQLNLCDKSQGKILKCVKKVVQDLNKLNEKCDFELIETDQREDLCDFIQNAAEIAGLTQSDDDITEEWREW